MKVYNNLLELIGNTPLVELHNFEKSFNLNSKIIAKIEKFNPAGSSKDRVALKMVEEAEKKGLIKKGGTIIEPTSGNTGIGLAMVAAIKGYKVILTMPDTMSEERRKLLKAYGAELILTDGKLGMQGAVEKANELLKTIENAFIPSQFTNQDNPKSHFETTGPEIWQDMDGKIDIFIASIGTGGTLSGVGKFLKSKNPEIKIIGVEPYSSPLLTKNVAGPHKIQGIGANFIPETLDKTIYDEIIDIKDEDAIKTGSFIAKNEGLLVGISSGAVLAASIEIAKKYENKNIVILLPDTGERYLTSEMFS